MTAFAYGDRVRAVRQVRWSGRVRPNSAPRGAEGTIIRETPDADGDIYVRWDGRAGYDRYAVEDDLTLISAPPASAPLEDPNELAARLVLARVTRVIETAAEHLATYSAADRSRWESVLWDKFKE